MSTNTCIILAVLSTIAALLVTSCAPIMPTPEVVTVKETVVVKTEGVAVTEIAAEATPAAAASAKVGEYVAAAGPNRPNRMIIKNAELKLLVADTDVAIDRIAQVAADTGGYIISTRVRYDEWLEEQYKYASITLGVPVDQFELAMRRLRQLALLVADESASGQDVTDEYVDLKSRLDNLIATRDRIREFLDQATTVEESLRVNEQLSAIEEQIEQVQGRMNYLFDRAAYSTITVQLDPDLPQPTPSPTPTPTPPWSPVETIEQAGGTLGSILRTLVELAIWLGIVVMPLVGPPVLIIWFLWWLLRRRRGQQTKSETTQP